jgi:hypothetical protein
MAATVRTVLAALVLSVVASPMAHAGPYGDDLAKCLVERSSSKDKTELVRWMFAAMSAHPDVKDLSAVTAEGRDTANRSIAELTVRLLTDTCRDEADKAVRYEGGAAIESSFNVLGQVAAKELFASPDVAGVLAGLEKHLDGKKLEQLGKGAREGRSEE